MTAAVDLIGVVVTILGVGVVAQFVADRLRVPSVMFLIVAGVVVGPDGLAILTDAMVREYRDVLQATVGLSVAIVVFEGAFHLRLERIRHASRESFRLVTIGAIGSLVGTAVVVRYVLGQSWPLSFLVGSLLVATGPTVITPIMSVVPVRERVASTLETEGVVNDVTAAVLAIVTFEYVLLEPHGPSRLLWEFGLRFGLGILVGCAVAAVVYVVLQRGGASVDNAPRNARLFVLVAALVMYGIAEVRVSESGIAAVAAGGFVLGNLDIPYRDDVAQFKGDVTLIVISFVFITLAALLSIEDVLGLGLAGVLAVLAIALVLRPALVFACTIGERFTLSERAFVSVIGPRGIIPASVATLFALELRPEQPAAATTLVGTVFLVIFATVVFQGGLARHIAQALDVIPRRTIVVGGGRVGRALARRLEDRGEEVVVIDADADVVERLRGEGFATRHGDGTSDDLLAAAGAENAGVVAAATADDDTNLLVGQLAKNRFDVETVVARVNDPENEPAFEDLDVEAISTGMSVAWSMDNVIERPAIARWMTELDRRGDVQEVEVTDDEAVGKTVGEFSDLLPGDCYLALVSRGDENELPHEEHVIRRGDHLTFIGRREAVREAIEFCTA